MLGNYSKTNYDLSEVIYPFNEKPIFKGTYIKLITIKIITIESNIIL